MIVDKADQKEYNPTIINFGEYKMNGNLKKKLGSLVIFRNIIKLPIIESLIRLDSVEQNDTGALIYAYGDFMSCLLSENSSLSIFMNSLL